MTGPADDDVRDVVKWLRSRAGIPASPDFPAVAAYLTRAADLLDQRLFQPIPASERPEQGDCDEQGRVWVHQPHEACPESPAWELMLAKYASSNYGATCWLPAHALPLPVKVQP